MRHFSKTLLLFSLLQTSIAYADCSLPPIDGETPGSLSCVYGLTAKVPGCRISNSCAVPHSGSGRIAVIEGGHDPDAYGELTYFSQQFGLNVLPQCNGSNAPCFQTYYASGNTCSTTPIPFDRVAINEPQIDIEWAHAMAPYASIYIVETSSYDLGPMINGVQCANTILQAQGGGYVSFSDSFAEFAGEKSYDSNFQTPGVTYVASSGDYQAPARYPSTSPFVISAGGTMITRNSSGDYIEQVGWKNTEIPCDPGTTCKTGVTGGPSSMEPRPAYQNSVQKIVGNSRGTPDISFVAQGVDVFCCSFNLDTTDEQCCARAGTSNPAKPWLSTCQTVPSNICESSLGVWIKTGGTSLAAPALTGIMNSAHSGATTSTQELTTIYNGAVKNYNSYWTDITKGNNGFPALKGYDFVTGLGVPLGYSGK